MGGCEALARYSSATLGRLRPIWEPQASSPWVETAYTLRLNIASFLRDMGRILRFHTDRRMGSMTRSACCGTQTSAQAR